MDTIKAATKILRDGMLLLPDEAKAEFKAQASDIFIHEAINNACGALNGSKEKETMLKAYAVQEANRMVTMLWREELLTPELEKEYRALPKMVEMANEYNQYTDDRKRRMDEIMEKHKAIAEEEKELDIFKGIVNGISAEDSAKKYDEWQKQQQAAMRG